MLGLTGAGGGILAVPALVLGLGLSITEATPVALIAVGSAAALGCTDGLRGGIVRYKAAMLMAAAWALFSPIGVVIAHRLSNEILMMLFSVVMLRVACESQLLAGYLLPRREQVCWLVDSHLRICPRAGYKSDSPCLPLPSR